MKDEWPVLYFATCCFELFEDWERLLYECLEQFLARNSFGLVLETG
jgi:hypothetical protein